MGKAGICRPARSNFDGFSPLSETVRTSNRAVSSPNRRLLWDGEKMEVTNDAAPSAHLRWQYRQGWTL